jgi:hypothetical protein
MLLDPEPVHMRHVVNEVTMGQDFILVLLFCLLISVHQCYILTSTQILLLSEGQAGDNWKPSNKAVRFIV